MNIDLLSALIFFILLYTLFFIFRNKFETQGRFFVMYKTKLGLKIMNRISTKDDNTRMPFYGSSIAVIGIILAILGLVYQNVYLGGFGLSLLVIGILVAIPLNWLGYFGTALGFTGMAAIILILLKGAYDTFFKPAVAPTVTPLLPGIQLAPGIPILSFWHWIIGILIIAGIHEFSHGLYARFHKVPLKSSGFAFLGPLLAAFVEPNEKVMAKKRKRKQLQILSAGPISNVITGVLFLIIGSLIITPLVSSSLQFSGLVITGINEDSGLNNSTVKIGDVITAIDNTLLENASSAAIIIEPKKPGDTINITTLNKTESIILAKSSLNSTKPSLGIYASSYYGEIPFNTNTGLWLIELFFWLYVISFGVGLFNLLPLGPVDGGRMFYLASFALFKKERKAKKYSKYMSLFCILLILLNLLPFIVKMLRFLVNLL